MSDEEIRRVFSNNLNHFMNIKGKTQADLYRYMGVSSATASNWCNGIKLPRLDKIQTICNWLDIEKADLLEQKKQNSVEEPFYYFNDEARDMAQFMFENPEYKVLFDASRNVRKEDIQFIKEMIDRLSGN